MRFLRVREADGVFDVPGVRGGWGPVGDGGEGRLIIRVADAKTKVWVERGRCHLRRNLKEWIGTRVGEMSEGLVDGWPLV